MIKPIHAMRMSRNKRNPWDTNEIVKKIGALIEVDISDTDISVSHRIPLSNNGEAGSTPIRHPAIVVFSTKLEPS